MNEHLLRTLQVPEGSVVRLSDDGHCVVSARRDLAHYARLAFYTAGTVVLVALAIRLLAAGL